MAQTKATKKFEKNKLKGVLERRKNVAKIKQKKQVAEKKKARNAREQQDQHDEDGAAQTNGAKHNEGSFANMSVDEFFQGGFDVPELPKKSKLKPKTGKRKRTPVDSDDEDEGTADLENGAEMVDSMSENDSEDEVGDHKQQLEALAKNDPEFYKHLQDEDPELLDFGDDVLANIQLSESDDEEPRRKKGKKNQDQDIESDDEETFGEEERSNEVTPAMIRRWHTALAEKKSLRQMREVVLAFRAAVRSNDEDDKEYKYSISDPEVYHELLLTAMTDIPAVISHHLPIKESASGKLRVPVDGKKFRTLNPILKTYAASMQHLLSSLSDAATLKLTLTSLRPVLPYILSFKKLIREICRTVSSIYASPSHADVTRIAAFMVLRQLTVIGDPSIREAVLKASYQGIVQGSRNTTIHNLTGINLMKNSGVELWGLVDASQAYTQAFTFIRQLAIHLRNSILNKTKDKENYKQVYNWQFVHSLDFWSRVLSTYCSSNAEATAGKASPLKPLIYPLVQIALATTRLLPTPSYYPLRFHLIRLLVRLARTTETYIPLAPILLEVLNSPECRKKPKAASLAPVDWDVSIRVSKAYLHTRVWQDGLGEQVTELLGDWAGQWAKSIAFPEMVLPVTVMLKRWLKAASGKRQAGTHGQAEKKSKRQRRQEGGNQNSKLNGQIALLVQKLDANARFVEARRANVEFAPTDRTGVQGFLRELEWEKTPLGAFISGQRKIKQEKAKVLEQGRAADDARKKKERAEQNGAPQAIDAFENDDADEDDEDLEELSDQEAADFDDDDDDVMSE